MSSFSCLFFFLGLSFGSALAEPILPSRPAQSSDRRKGEMRYSVVGMGERTITSRNLRIEETSSGSFRPERRNPINDANITKFKLDPANPPKSDWTAFDARTDADNHAAALSDPDAQPSTPEQLERARRVVDVRIIRERLGLTQEQFARRFGLSLDLVRGWEERRATPDGAALVLLRVIWAEPERVRKVVAAE